MSDVTEIAGFIDPIVGDDATGQPDNPEFPYQTIDGFYTSQSPSPTGILTAKVQTGNVFLGLKEYINLQVVDISGSPNAGAILTIFGQKGVFIHFDSVFLQINTEVTLEADPDDGTMDLPVFVIDNDFAFGPGYFLDILEQNNDFATPNRARDIFNFDGLTKPATADISQIGSDVVVNRNGAIFFGGTLFNSNTFAKEEKFPATNFYQSSVNSVFASIVADEPSNLIYHQFPTGLSGIIEPLAQADPPTRSCNTPTQIGVISGLLVLIPGVSIAISAAFGEDILAYVALPRCTAPPTFPAISNPKVAAKAREVQRLIEQGLPTVTVTGGSITASETGPVYFTDIKGVQINNLNLKQVEPFLDDATEEAATFNLQQEFNSQFNSGSIFRRPNIITADYTHTRFDGEIFLIDATNNDIIVIIPNGPISNNRLFEYRRLDKTEHKVTITSPGKIDDFSRIRLANEECHLNYLRLFGLEDRIIVLSYSSPLCRIKA